MITIAPILAAVSLPAPLSNLAIYALIAIAVLALFAPALLKRLKDGIVTAVKNRLPELANLPALQDAEPVAAETSLAKLLNEKLPDAPADSKLKWIIDGYSLEEAQSEYIAMLQDRVKALTPSKGAA